MRAPARREAVATLAVLALLLPGLAVVAVPPGSWWWLPLVVAAVMLAVGLGALRRLRIRLELDRSGRLRVREPWPLTGDEVDLTGLEVVVARTQPVHGRALRRQGERTVLILRDRTGATLWCGPGDWEDDGRLLGAVRSAVRRTRPEVIGAHLLDLDEAAGGRPEEAVAPAAGGDGGPSSGVGEPVSARLRPGQRAVGVIAVLVSALMVLPPLVVGLLSALLFRFAGASLGELASGLAGMLGASLVALVTWLVGAAAAAVLGVRAVSARLRLDGDGRLTVRSVWPWRRRRIDLRELARVRAQPGVLVGRRRPTRVVLTDRTGVRLVVVADAWRDSGRLREQLAGWAARTHAEIDPPTARWLARGAPPRP